MRALLTRLGVPEHSIELVVSRARGVTWIVRGEGRAPERAVVRVHRGVGPNRVAHEHAVLEALGRVASPVFRLSIPAALARVPFGPGEATLLGFLAGSPLTPAREVSRLRGQLEAVRIWLAELWSLDPPEALGEPYTASAILVPLDAEVEALGPIVAAGWRAARSAAERLDARRAVVCHFDLGPSNVLTTAGGVGVIDWEYARRAQPLYDWVRFVVQMALAWRRVPPDLSQPLADDGVILDAVERAFFAPGELGDVVASETIAAAVLAGLEPGAIDGLVRASLLQYLMPQIPWRDRRAALARLLGGRTVVGALV